MVEALDLDHGRREYFAACAMLDALQATQPPAEPCRGCGCTDDHPCVTPAGPCHWVEPGVCSACVQELASDIEAAGILEIAP